MTPAAPASARRPATPPVAAADDLVRVAHRDERDLRAGRARSRAIRASEPSSVAPARSAADDARWSVAPSASGSEYGSPTSSRSAPASIAGEGDREARLGVRVAGDDVRDERGAAVARRAPRERGAAIRRRAAGRCRGRPTVGVDRPRRRASSALIGRRLPALERREVLVAAARQSPSRTTVSAGYGPARPVAVPASRRGRTANACAVSSAGRIPSVRVTAWTAATASASVAAATSRRPAAKSAAICGPTPG